MNENEDIQALEERFTDYILERTATLGKPTLIIKREGLIQLCEAAKNELGYDYLACITAIDYLSHFVIVYNLWSYAKNRHLILKTSCPREEAIVPSVTKYWKSAMWLERETYDLMGIKFSGHPNLKRILLPEPWVGHPLRKDYDMEREQFVSKGQQGEDVVSFNEGEGSSW